MRFTLRLCLCAVSILAPVALGAADGAAEPPTDAKSLAAVLRPDLPKGWTLEIRGDRVIIERTKPVEVYNAINRPPFENEAELRRYFAPYVRKEQFVISLKLGERMTPAAVKAGSKKNREAFANALKDARHRKLMTTREFWERHPEYGYRELPSFDAGKHSIYMKVSPSRTTAEFWSASVEQECEAVLSLLDKRFQAY